MVRMGLLLVAALLTLTACTRVSVVYNTADFFIERYADGYLSLDSAQLASWRPALAETLGRHRQEELPYLAAFFADLETGAREGFDATQVGCLVGEFEEIYRRHFRLAVDLAAPLLASLEPSQVRALERKFVKDRAEEIKEGAAASARRDRKRAKRYTENAKWWIGPLSAEQQAIITEVTAAMPDTAAAWAAYRNARQDRLIRLLDRRAPERELHRFLTEWLVEYRDLPPELQRARREVQQRIVELFLRMDASFTLTQRAHFAKRLATLRDDFLRLQKRPKRAELRCPSEI
jgi:hypothetical protein